MPSKPNFHRLALAHLKGLCSEFHVTKRPRLYTKRWPKGYNDAIGLCDHDANAIYVRLEAHDDIGQLYDTVAHELAHIIAGRKTGDVEHGKSWRKEATKLGATTDE